MDNWLSRNYVLTSKRALFKVAFVSIDSVLAGKSLAKNDVEDIITNFEHSEVEASHAAIELNEISISDSYDLSDRIDDYLEHLSQLHFESYEYDDLQQKKRVLLEKKV